LFLSFLPPPFHIPPPVRPLFFIRFFNQASPRRFFFLSSFLFYAFQMPPRGSIAGPSWLKFSEHEVRTIPSLSVVSRLIAPTGGSSVFQQPLFLSSVDTKAPINVTFCGRFGSSIVSFLSWFLLLTPLYDPRNLVFFFFPNISPPFGTLVV